MEHPDVPELLQDAKSNGLDVDLDDVDVLPRSRDDPRRLPADSMGEVEESALRAPVAQLAATPTTHFKLPPGSGHRDRHADRSVMAEPGASDRRRSPRTALQSALRVLSRLARVADRRDADALVAVGWQVYEITGKALALGLSGLALFLPGFLLALARRARRGSPRSTQDPDRVPSRRRALRVGARGDGVHRVKRPLRRSTPCSGVLGLIRAFSGPAGQALMPSLVDEDAARARRRARLVVPGSSR